MSIQVGKYIIDPEKNVKLHIIFWLGFLIITTYFTVENFDFEKAFIRQCVFGTSDIGYFYFIAYFLFPRFFEKKKYTEFFGILLLTFTILIFLRGWVGANYLYTEKIAAGIIQKKGAFLFAGFTIFGSTSMAIAYRLFLNAIKSQQREVELRNEKLQAEMNFLKAQVNPHFLFNALNNIYGLSFIQSPKTPEMVLKLSDFLRHNLYRGGSESVKLEDEIQYIQNYIDLYNIKYEKPLNIDFDYKEANPAMKVEPLLFINFVENAFKHSDIESGNGFINIKLSSENKTLHFYIENSLSPGNVKDKTGGIGLENVKKRLELIYPKKHKLKVEEKAGKFIVQLQIDTE